MVLSQLTATEQTKASEAKVLRQVELQHQEKVRITEEQKLLQIKQAPALSFSGIPSEHPKKEVPENPAITSIVVIRPPDPLKELQESLRRAQTIALASSFFGLGCLFGAFLFPSLMFGFLCTAALLSLGGILGLGLASRQKHQAEKEGAIQSSGQSFEASSFSITVSSKTKLVKQDASKVTENASEPNEDKKETVEKAVEETPVPKQKKVKAKTVKPLEIYGPKTAKPVVV